MAVEGTAAPTQVVTPAGQAPTGTEGEAEQHAEPEAVETPKPRTYDEALVSKLRAENAKARVELKALRDAQEAEHQKSLAEQGKFKELFEAEKVRAEQLAARAAKHDEFVRATLDVELAQVPEQFRVVVPPGAPEDQLNWVRTAKATGIFNPPGAPAAPPAPAPRPTTAITSPPAVATPAPNAQPLTPAEEQAFASPRTPAAVKAELALKNLAYRQSRGWE